MLPIIIITEPFIINNNNNNRLRNFVPLVNTASFSLVKNTVTLVTRKEMEQQKRRNKSCCYGCSLFTITSTKNMIKLTKIYALLISPTQIILKG